MSGGAKKERRPRRLVEEAKALVDWCFAKLAWVPIALSIFAGVVASVGWALFGVWVTSDWAPFWFAVGLLGTSASGVGVSLIEWARRREKSAAVGEATDALLTSSDAFHPALEQLKRLIARPNNREAELQKVISKVTDSRTILFNERLKSRMVVYRLLAAQGTRKRRLHPEQWSGRRPEPKEFVDGDGGRGDAAFAWLVEGSYKFVADISAESDILWRGSGRGYETYISVPVVFDGEAVGMLTLDSAVPGDLDETDVPALEVLASLLGSAFAMTRR